MSTDEPKFLATPLTPELTDEEIMYDGLNAYVSKPVADPIQRKLSYVIELYGRPCE